MVVLVTGANGLVGSAMVDLLLRREIDIVGGYHSDPPQFDIPLVQLDITDTNAVASLLDSYDINTVINCAAFTDVDACETDPELANEINGSAPGRIAALCSDRDIDFVHFSTDYVFDGRSEALYTETDPTNPVQIYGISKLAGERSVRDVNSESLILRLSFVYGARGDTDELIGFPRWVAETLHAGDEVPLFTDQHLTPSRAGQVAKTTLSLTDSNVSGLVHVANQSCVTPYEFGKQVCDLIDENKDLITPSSMMEIDRVAERPRHSCLDVSNVENILDRRQPTLAEDLTTLKGIFDSYNS